jgi:hypothetical protein
LGDSILDLIDAQHALQLVPLSARPLLHTHLLELIIYAALMQRQIVTRLSEGELNCVCHVWRRILNTPDQSIDLAWTEALVKLSGPHDLKQLVTCAFRERTHDCVDKWRNRLARRYHAAVL